MGEIVLFLRLTRRPGQLGRNIIASADMSRSVSEHDFTLQKLLLAPTVTVQDSVTLPPYALRQTYASNADMHQLASIAGRQMGPHACACDAMRQEPRDECARRDRRWLIDDRLERGAEYIASGPSTMSKLFVACSGAVSTANQAATYVSATQIAEPAAPFNTPDVTYDPVIG